MIDTPILVATALTAGAATAQPTTVTALTTGGKLVTFASSAPGTLLTTATVTGLQPDETLLGIDHRQRTGELYGLGSSSRLYKLGPATGAATAVGAGAFTPALNGTSFDFYPTVDRIRVVSNADQNLCGKPQFKERPSWNVVASGVAKVRRERG